jgi:hypothetical protein
VFLGRIWAGVIAAQIGEAMNPTDAFSILAKALDDAGGACMRWGAALGCALGLGCSASMLALGGGGLAALACGSCAAIFLSVWLIGQLCDQAQARVLGPDELLALDAMEWSSEAALKIRQKLAARAGLGLALRVEDVEPAWLAQRKFEEGRRVVEREKIVLELNERIAKRFASD